MRSNHAQPVLLFLLVVLCFFLASCASVPIPPAPEVISGPQTRADFPRRDVYHTVAPGETIWRLAKMYDVKDYEIRRANSIRRSEDLQMGETIRIPHAAPMRSVIPLYPSKKWKYIIIHHSATDEGTSLDFHKAHLSRGWDRGVGYHFIIDNGSKGKGDGQIEIGPRWIKQQDGAHCKASDMNINGIGICLVGNFSEERVSQKQMESLVYLVNKLRKYYRIPSRRILGHGEVKDAHTECPGTNFPWKRFRRELWLTR